MCRPTKLTMTTLRSFIRQQLAIIFLLSITAKLQAQHYPAGSEGIKAASLPSPGFYFEDYNSFYFYNKLQGFGAQGQSGSEQFSYTQTPRLMWITPWHIGDADFGAAVRIPLVERLYTHSVPYGPPISTIPFPTYNYKTVTDSQFGLSDIQVEPLILAWHLKQFDFVASYSLWIPTGDWNTGPTLSIPRTTDTCPSRKRFRSWKTRP